MVKERRVSGMKTDLYEVCWYHKYVCRPSRDSCWKEEGAEHVPTSRACREGWRLRANINTKLLNVYIYPYLRIS